MSNYMRHPQRNATKLGISILLITAMNSGIAAEVVDFESDRWTYINADTATHLGRKCLKGIAYLEDLDFENGVIEVDMAFNGSRSYPGFIFRKQDSQNYERFYIRPHRATGLYSDALQYTPVISGIAGWQLYSGDGFTASIDAPLDEWLHFKMEINGAQARLFVGDSDEPVLVINDLKHGSSSGPIGVFGPMDGSAFFSNFEYRIDNNLQFDPPPVTEPVFGMITEWEISQVFDYSEIETEQSYAEQNLDITWEKIRSHEKSGLIDVARFRTRGGGSSDWIWARTTLTSEDDEIRRISLGYSDYLSVFLNGQLLMTANSAYQSRDPGFSGIIGLFDDLNLPLTRGDNELLILVGETFGGWGFMCRDRDARYQQQGITELWTAPLGLKYPESAVYDIERDVLYVSNFYNARNEFLSRVKTDGTIDQLEWVSGLSLPTGLAIYNDKLYAVERRSLAEIDLATGEIVKRYEIPSPAFPNDVAVDSSGTIYISDSDGNKIYRFANNEFEIWMAEGEIKAPNSLHIDGDNLIVGNSGDYSLKAINLSNNEVRTIATLTDGAIIDGIVNDERGNYIVSDFYGKLYRITPEGEKTLLMDVSAVGYLLADFEYIKRKNLLVFPGLYNCRLRAFKYLSD